MKTESAFKCAAIVAALLFAIVVALLFATSAKSQGTATTDFSGMVSAAAAAARERIDLASAPKAVKAIFSNADKIAEEGCINFCGFYLGMTVDNARALAAYYKLNDGEWRCWTVLGTREVYRLKFSLKGVRRVTKGGNTFEDLFPAVANRIGKMKPNDNGDSDLIGYEYKNIDGQRAFMSEKDGLLLEDGGLSRAAIEMVPIPGRNYAIGKYEVTQALWEAVMGGNPSWFKGADRPVVSVSWNDCQKFLEKLNAMPEVKGSGVTYRLPTADEWEYACRAGATGDYCRLADGTEITGDTLGTVAWYEDNSEIDGMCQTHPVGQKKPNAFGLYDMHGNVWEWTSTADGTNWVDCGGSWYSRAKGCEAGSLPSNAPDNRYSDLGFRLAR